MHRDDYNVAPRAESSDVPAHRVNIGDRNSRIDIAPISVALIVGVAKKAEANAVSDHDNARMCRHLGIAASNRLYAMRTKPVDSVLHAVRPAIARMIVCCRGNRYAA